MTCRGCGPSPDPEQDREHNDWCPDNPRRTHRGKDDAVALRVENERLRAALADMLAALAAVEAHFGGWEGDGPRITPEILVAVRAAIAKAKGDTDGQRNGGK
jgi:hypothetical protein